MITCTYLSLLSLPTSLRLQFPLILVPAVFLPLSYPFFLPCPFHPLNLKGVGPSGGYGMLPLSQRRSAMPSDVLVLRRSCHLVNVIKARTRRPISV